MSRRRLGTSPQTPTDPSWRMPTPKQMEKLATEAARRLGPSAAALDAPLPAEYWESVLKDPRRRHRCSEAAATSFGNSAPCAARLLPPLRADLGNSDCRCSPIVWRQRGLEGRCPAAARQHLPAAHRKTRRRRVLAGFRQDLELVCAWMSGWRQNTTPRRFRAETERL